MKYKVGDKVKLKSKEGLDELKRQVEGLRIHPDAYKYAGSEQTILECNEGYYRFDVSSVLWHECLFEGLVEDTDERLLESAADACKKVDEMLEARYQKDKTYYDGEQWSTEFECPDGNIFKDENGNVINATKIILEKKNIIREEQIDNAAQEYMDSDNAVLTYSDGFCEQTDHPFVRAAFKAGVEWADNNVIQDDCSKAPKLTSQDYSNGRFGYRLPAGFKAKLTERELILTPEKKEYPKTLGECRAILGIMSEYGAFHYKAELITTFMSLLICRDAYWKIAGDEMGLGTSWKPDYDSGVDKFGIICLDGVVQESNPTTAWERHLNKILDFPTKEMRDVFYENFKKDIELCKELL